MRTTLDIDDDVLQAAKELARQDGVSTGKMISTLTRRGLKNGNGKKSGTKQYVNGVPVFPSRGGIVTMEQIRKIMDLEGI